MAVAPSRLTIGFLTANIHVGASRALWPGIVAAAEARDVNLICFPGGGMHVREGWEAQRNVIYDLVNAGNVDGLVTWASTVCGTLDPAESARFHRRYRPLPMVSLTPLDGTATVTVDSYQGMRAGVAHMVEVHGCRRLAFVRGPEHHYYARERYHAYVEALRHYGIPFDARLVTEPVAWDAGVEAIRILLDERGLRPPADLDAVVAVSDLLALDALRALQTRGIAVPGDVAVAGFNDSAEGRSCTPPLTTVSLPFRAQGAQALDNLLAQLAGKQTPERVVLPCKLIRRQSCGCPSYAVLQATAGPAVAAARGQEVSRSALQADLIQALGEAQAGDGLADRLLDALQADLGRSAPGCFLTALQQAMAEGSEALAWQGAISTLRRHLLPYLGGEGRTRAEDLFGQARVLAAELGQRARTCRQLEAERQSQTWGEIGQALLTTFDVERLADALADSLPGLGIASAYLALYEEPATSLERARLVLAYTEEGRVPLEHGGRPFPSGQLVPEGLRPRRRHSLVVEPLYFRTEQIGFALLEAGPRDPAGYEVLRGHISSALKGALLFREASQARRAAEKADQIKMRLLANVSHELRTPLNIILGYTKDALASPEPYGIAPPPALLSDLRQIQQSAEHQLRVVNDLLDLSRAEIDELDLYLETLDPWPLLASAYRCFADRADPEGEVIWHLDLPKYLPLVRADPVRLRQILFNLLSNAARLTERGYISVGARVSPPYLHIWVKDTGPGIPQGRQERIFEPFAMAGNGLWRSGGVGLGLSIARRVVALHGGSMALDSQPGEGSTFHVYLPLPISGDQPVAGAEPVAVAEPQPALLLISASEQPAAEIVEFGRRQGLALLRLQTSDDLEAALATVRPAVLAWDVVSPASEEWALVRRLRNHPRLCHLPFIFYGQEARGEAALTLGLTSCVVKPASNEKVQEAVRAAQPKGGRGPVLIVDDDPRARALYQQLAAEGLPGQAIRTADDGVEALAIMEEETPSLVLLDLMMPNMDGFDLLDRMRADPRTRRVPVVILSSRLLSLDDVKRLEQHAGVTLHTKGILSEAETIAGLSRAFSGANGLSHHTGALAKRAVAYLHRNYARPLARWEVAEAIGVSEDYLSRVFQRELGLTPWEYLNRYRVHQARALLRGTSESVKAIARRVGFKDQAYFSRVFRGLTGLPPNAYRERAEP